MENEERISGSSDFGRLLRRYRLAAGLSQEALAERAGMSANGVGALERGYRRTPQRETLALLSRALALNDAERKEFQAAAASSAPPRSRESTSGGADPWTAENMTNLPIALSTFVGREDELSELRRLVREHRLVTLVGSPGVGKTRLALQIGAALSEASELAVCFVELGPIGNPALVAGAIAAALNLHEMPGRSLLQTLATYLRNKTMLMILDNCEHVVDESAVVASALLAESPGLRILATSREPLRIAGEHTYRLPSLPFPTLDGRRWSAADVAPYAAIALFEKRARAVDHTFTITDDNAAIVAATCARLDGIPLAIELAAARVNALSVASLAEMLDDRFRLLSGNERGTLPRQQTMHAAIEWSYDLLSEPEQQVFERLSVFVGGCTLETATVVCSEDYGLESDTLAVLSSLVDKSLLVADLEGVEPRYRLLESVREYAHQRLLLGGEATPTARRHAQVCLERAERLNSVYDTEPDFVWDEFAGVELDNWRAALDWAFDERGDASIGLRLIGELALVWTFFAPLEGRRRLTRALQLVTSATPSGVLAKMRYAEALIASKLDEPQLELLPAVEALALYLNLDDRLGIALCQSHAGRALISLGRDVEALPLVREALTHARALRAGKHLAFVLRVAAYGSSVNGDFDAARSQIAEAVAIYSAIGADRLAAIATAGDLSEYELYAGNFAIAFDQAAEAIRTLRRYNDSIGLALGLNNTSACLINLQRYDEAEVYVREVLEIPSERQGRSQFAHALQRLAAVAILRAPRHLEVRSRTYERAAKLLAYASALLVTAGSPRVLYNKREYERVIEHLRDAIPPDDFAELLETGSAWTEEAALAEARAL